MECVRCSALEHLGLANVGLGMESAHLIISILTNQMYLPRLTTLDLSRNPLAGSVPLAREHLEQLNLQMDEPQILLDECVERRHTDTSDSVQGQEKLTHSSS